MWTALKRGLFLGACRLRDDPTGRVALIATGSAAIGLASAFWSLGDLAVRVIDRDLLARRLGVGATPAIISPRATGIEAVRGLRGDPHVMVECERTTVLAAADRSLRGASFVLTTPQYLTVNGGIGTHGHAFTWSDTLSLVPSAFVSRGLALPLGSRVTLFGTTYRVTGLLGPGARADDDYVVVALLSGRAVDGACGDGAMRRITVLAAPTEVSSVAKVVRGRLAAALGILPADQLLTAKASERDLRLWRMMRRTARAAIVAGTLVVGTAATLTILVLLNVRGRTRRFEIGVARVVGATIPDIKAELLGEAMLLGVISAVTGSGASIAAVGAASRLFGIEHAGARLAVLPPAVASCAICLALAWPVVRARRETPVALLGAEEW